MTHTPNPTAERWRKKPVEIEAMQWDGSAASATPIIDWVLAGGGTANYYDPQPATRAKGRVVREPVPALLVIRTLEGSMQAIPGDWIIRGVQGEFYPCKPDIFQQTYELADSLSEGAPSEEQIERVAKSLFENGLGEGDCTWAELIVEDPSRADIWREDARRALNAADGIHQGSSALSPLWCGSDSPHDAHRDRNKFGGFNECTGRPALTAAGVAPQEPPEELVQLDVDESGNPIYGCVSAPPRSREKLIAEAERFAKGFEAENYYRTPSMIRELIALSVQPVLDPEKVAEVLKEWGTEPEPMRTDIARYRARTLCEAAKRGELT